MATVHAILDGIKNGKLISEIYDEVRSSTVYGLFKELRKNNFILCREERKGKTRYKKCELTEKGDKLLVLVKELIELDQAP